MPKYKNTTLALNLMCIVVGMLLLTAASVPLYRLFCQVTGYGGTTQQAALAPKNAISRTMTIRFNADTEPGLPWEFKPAEKEMKIQVGKQQVTHYIAKNKTNRPVTGHATYNVLPFAAGAYFVKISCFCFNEQTLEPHQQVEMPVVFYVDPAINDDPEMKDVKTITLSYTFFPVKTETAKTPE